MNAEATMNTTPTIDNLDAIGHASRHATSLERQRDRRRREDHARHQAVELFQQLSGLWLRCLTCGHRWAPSTLDSQSDGRCSLASATAAVRVDVTALIRNGYFTLDRAGIESSPYGVE
jgi:hypothetical protein